ncbi:unnamed protein product [Schistosoma curassoni]|uniref:Uncharacterized protein n=1 Tax=Schistosoma curassoni TaxID=6186 RepID=A0A183JYX0_9TREM|nr:unnamed protein product [Schistosoma curassoni]
MKLFFNLSHINFTTRYNNTNKGPVICSSTFHSF